MGIEKKVKNNRENFAQEIIDSIQSCDYEKETWTVLSLTTFFYPEINQKVEFAYISSGKLNEGGLYLSSLLDPASSPSSVGFKFNYLRPKISNQENYAENLIAEVCG